MRTENSTGTVSSYSYRSNTSNWIVYRLTDIALMKAEALIQSRQEAGMEEAIIMANVSYKRANPTGDSLSVSNYSTYGQVADLILRERQRELMFEGKRWFDLMRLARRENSPASLVSYISKVTTGSEALGKMSSMNALYWPINKSELEANTALTQNPFYESELSSSAAN
jgi:SusD family.